MGTRTSPATIGMDQKRGSRQTDHCRCTTTCTDRMMKGATAPNGPLANKPAPIANPQAIAHVQPRPRRYSLPVQVANMIQAVRSVSVRTSLVMITNDTDEAKRNAAHVATGFDWKRRAYR